MPRRKVRLVAGEYYHVYNRGNNRQDIFFDRENYWFFLRRLYQYFRVSEGPHRTLELCTVIAYCLMPNHFHLLLQPRGDQLSRYFQMLAISYTKAINAHHNRVGALFQGAFQAKNVDRDEYLLHLSRYIHLNPVHAGLVERPDDWEFSSYREYIGTRTITLPKPDIVLAQFPSRDAYRQFVEAHVPYAQERIAHLLFEE